MPWVKFDDQYPINRKVEGLSDAAYRLDTEAICWCNRNLTDGHIRRTQLESCSNAPRTSRKWRANLARTVAELVRESRWHEPGHDCPKCPQPIDGWVIHDYLQFQPSRADVLRERAAKAERQRRWMESQKRGRDTSRSQTRDATRDATRDTPATALETVAPSPPRPEGKRGGDLPVATAARRQAADAAADGREDQNHADPAPVDWRSLPAAGAPREPEDAERARRGAAAARAGIRRPAAPAPKLDALERLRAATPDIPVPGVLVSDAVPPDTVIVYAPPDPTDPDPAASLPRRVAAIRGLDTSPAPSTPDPQETDHA